MIVIDAKIGGPKNKKSQHDIKIQVIMNQHPTKSHFKQIQTLCINQIKIIF